MRHDLLAHDRAQSIVLSQHYPPAGEELSRLRGLSRLQQLQLRGCFRVSDVGLRSIGALSSLTSLDCQECWQVTTAGLAVLSGVRLRPFSWGAQHGLECGRREGLEMVATHDGVAAPLSCSRFGIIRLYYK